MNKEFEKRYKKNGDYLGYYLKDKETLPENRINGTTSIIGKILPFPTPLCNFLYTWGKRIKKKLLKEKVYIYDLYKNNLHDDELKDRIFPLNKIFDDELKRISFVGHMTEIAFYYAIKTKGDFDFDNILSLAVDLEFKNDLIKFKDHFDKQILVIYVNKSIRLAKKMYDEFVKKFETNNLTVINYQLELVDYDNMNIGIIDFVIKNHSTNEIYMIDLKTGAKVMGNKLESAKFQLLGSYLPKFEKHFNKRPDKIMIVSSVEEEIKLGLNLKQEVEYVKIIDLTNDENENFYQKIFDAQAFIYNKCLEKKIIKKSSEKQDFYV